MGWGSSDTDRRAGLRDVRASRGGHRCGDQSAHEMGDSKGGTRMRNAPLVLRRLVESLLGRKSGRDLADLVADIRRDANGRVDLSRHYEFGTELRNPIYVLC